MAVYLLTYDLRNPGQNYQTLYDALDRVKAVRVQESVWFVEVNQTASELRDVVKTYTDENDRIFVTGIAPQSDWAGTRMTPPSAEWLKARRG